MFKRTVNAWYRFAGNTSPQHLLIITFAFMIVIGTAALLLPFVQKTKVGFIDAFFTATSATCVTGLSTIDIGSAFNWYGQCIILLLIQFGGVGLMTFAAISFSLLGARISLNTRDILGDTLAIRDPGANFISTFKIIFFSILTIEFAGAFLLFIGFIRTNSLWFSLWNSVFLSVSAFCNAGFTLFSDSLAGVSVYIQSIIIVLIILGGLGHMVLAELYRCIKNQLLGRERMYAKYFSYHVRVVLVMTLSLLAVGTLTTYLFNIRNHEIGIFQAVFQSVTVRTAGFSSVSQLSFSTPSLLFIVLLMLIGGNAGSCAGGLKTTTLAVWLAHIRSILSGRNEISFMGMKIPLIIVSRVTQIIALAIVWNIIGLVVLSSFEDSISLQRLVFEEISAFATVGLSLDLTDKLSDYSRIWIILTMFVGRLGTLTIALALPRSTPLNINHPEGRILVG